MGKSTIGRRGFVKAGTGALAGFHIIGTAQANQHPAPRPTSLKYLDRNTYVHNMKVHGHLFAGRNRTDEIEMMAIGNRRFLFQQTAVIEVTDPLNPKVLGEGLHLGEEDIQLAYNKSLGKWILITSSAVPGSSSSASALRGKYDNPALIDENVQMKGLRGVWIYDATDPTNLQLLSKWSCDKGDPERELQTGSGAFHNYYDGGKYAYLDTAPDNSFVRMEAHIRHYANGVQIIDVSDPTKPKWVSDWWVPGMRLGEEAEYQKWREFGDQRSFTGKNGGFFVPQKLEEGGRYGYSTWGSLGFYIHDLKDPAKPAVASRWQAPYAPGGIQTYATDVSRLDRGFVITCAEALDPDCNQPWQDVYVLDVKDVANPTPIGTFPIPQPPADAPYKDFCDKRGRFGSRVPENQKAPGKVDPNFTCYAYFIAGAQCFDLSDPANPKITAYFIPPQGGSLTDWNSYNRTVDMIFVEWDRKLIWVGTDTGIYLLSTPDLGEPVLGPMEVTEWSLPGLNAGHS